MSKHAWAVVWDDPQRLDDSINLYSSKQKALLAFDEELQIMWEHFVIDIYYYGLGAQLPYAKIYSKRYADMTREEREETCEREYMCTVERITIL
jgi:hypothetical protein